MALLHSCPMPAPFETRIGNIILMCSPIKMAWVNARRIIAGVHYHSAFKGRRSLGLNQREPMCEHPASATVKHTVMLLVTCSFPFPAMVRMAFTYFTPEFVDGILTEVHEPHFRWINIPPVLQGGFSLSLFYSTVNI